MEVVGALSRAAGDPAIPASRGGHVRPQTRHLLQRPRHRPEFPVFDLCGTKIGIQICYDRKYPEGSRLLALKGAEILFMPICAANYGETKLRDNVATAQTSLPWWRDRRPELYASLSAVLSLA